MMLLPLNSEKLSLDQQSLTSAYPVPEKRALSKTALYGVSALNIRGMYVPAELQMFNFHAYLPLLFIHPADAFFMILRSSHAVLGCASMKAEILHFQTCLD
ncbi:hypothetical protein T03_16178 [Trichinella britovi]|uniref:Uncharacterized protein n=2 Tax=Trichinella TaxID=6333 RepID=A0A0V1DB11_TRIBR|nr:hypothetical protein T05_10389 [Trichinella murrelli]KRX62518.1 hypothetical protein T09_692 [Trichinella sp. T9]KRY58813.1 hypothetical protein T03_16178 [Trichinella britovi]